MSVITDTLNKSPLLPPNGGSSASPPKPGAGPLAKEKPKYQLWLELNGAWRMVGFYASADEARDAGNRSVEWFLATDMEIVLVTVVR